MKKLISQNYSTYVSASTGQKEAHWARLFLFALISVFCAIFARDELYESYSVLVTSITILTGFTFTALFSDHTMADVGLPKPKNETDNQDIRVLGVLGTNFKARSSYFIALSIFAAVFMTFASMDWTVPSRLSSFAQSVFEQIESHDLLELLHKLDVVILLFNGLVTSLLAFIYLECVYTFYRLSETILSIVNLRRNYIRQSEKSS